MYRCMSSGGLLSQGAVRLQCRLGSARQSFNALCKRVFHLVVEARGQSIAKGVPCIRGGGAALAQCNKLATAELWRPRRGRTCFLGTRRCKPSKGAICDVPSKADARFALHAAL